MQMSPFSFGERHATLLHFCLRICLRSYHKSSHGSILLLVDRLPPCSTHAHADHLSGLCEGWSRGRIVASTETAQILLRRFPRISKSRFLAFDIAPEQPREVFLNDENKLTVTLIHANHCPGSAMFVVQGDFEGGTRLHTGDFRYDEAIHHPKTCSALQQLSHVYMDTTFFHPSWIMPTKSQSTEMILELLRHEALADTTESSSAAKKVKQIILAVDMLGQEDVLTAVQNKFESTHGKVVLPLNRCNQSKTNHNALKVWEDWLSLNELKGIVQHSEACSKCSICRQAQAGK
jgi:Cft2 family RNA processing exonuclease